MAELPKSYLEECRWLRPEGKSDDLILSSRIRLARNIEGIPFSQWASSSDLKRIAEYTRDAILSSDQMKNSDFFSIEELDSVDRYFLAERYLISRELAKSGIERYAVIHPEQTASVMINEEDHLRMQVLKAGNTLREIWQWIDSMDDQLENSLTYSYSQKYGYLTACPTNVGTGIRCSVMIHLPALVMSRKIEKVLNAVTQIGLTVRGMGGEGSEISGNLFQISNQWTLGISEEETIDKIEKILNQILDQERKAENQLMEDNPSMVKDKVWRALGTLKYARVLNSNELVELLSTLRLGRTIGLLESPSISSINEMLISLRPAHLQKRAGKSLSSTDRDIYRAEILRDWLQNGNV